MLSTPSFVQLSLAALFLISMGCEYLVYNLSHNLISHFLAQIVPAQATGCSFGVLLHQAAMSSSGKGCVCTITSFTFWHHKMLWALLVYSLSSSLEAAISLRNPNSSYCNVGSGNRVAMLAVLMTLEYGCLSLFLVTMARKYLWYTRWLRYYKVDGGLCSEHTFCTLQ